MPRYRRAVKARGHFDRAGGDEVPGRGHPVPGPDRHRADKMGHAVEALNAFAITFGDRSPAAETY
jgi:hypothetical protein